MPTPSDSTSSLPLERERSIHATCPPDDDRSGQWRVEVLDRLGRAVGDPIIGTVPGRHQEGSSSTPGTPDPLDSNSNRPEDKPSDHAINNVALIGPAEASPPLIGASPSSPHVDDKEAEPAHPTVTTSSALNLPYSIRYGIDSTRVCQLI